MFSIVVIAVAVGVFAMYFRHTAHMRRKQREALPEGENPPPAAKRP
jgi:hypothetical protein